ncbi:DNA repair protein RadC [Candidatus Poribacteria bacterium]|nr:DNA repair protein RadC [Candidatus Poribacteria bacterium]
MEVWEAMLAHVVDLSPSVAMDLERIRRRTWMQPTTQEAQLLALMVYLDMDLGDSRHRMKASKLLPLLTPGDANGAAVGAERPVGESNQRLMEALPEEKVNRLRRTVMWIAAADPVVRFETLPIPEAVQIIHQECEPLRGFRAYRWLAALGFHVAIPDRGRQRVLFRLGMLERIAGDAANRRRAFEILREWSCRVDAPLREVDLVLGIFAGSITEHGADSSVCLQDPSCDECPLTSYCDFYRIHAAEGGRRPPLSDLMRAEDLPRARLRTEGAESLTDPELIAALIQPAAGAGRALESAHRLLAEAESLDRLAAMTVQELAAVEGVGTASACTLKAAIELARRVQCSLQIPRGDGFDDPFKVYACYRNRFLGAKQEEFIVVHLNGRYQPLREICISKGSIRCATVGIADVFSEAMRDRIHSIMVIHNHPSGNPEPSDDDIRLTARIREAGTLFGIALVDHLIIGANSFYSFANKQVGEAGNNRSA